MISACTITSTKKEHQQQPAELSNGGKRTGALLLPAQLAAPRHRRLEDVRANLRDSAVDREALVPDDPSETAATAVSSTARP